MTSFAIGHDDTPGVLNGYFLADRGALVGDDVGVLAEATDDVPIGYARPATVLSTHSAASPAADRRARRKAAGQARKRNRPRR